MSTTSSRGLRLVGLRPMDACVIRVFLRLLAQDARLLQPWHITEQASADVWLVGGDGGMPKLPAMCIGVRVVPAHAVVPTGTQRVLRLPLQLEDFVAVLNAVSQPQAEAENWLDPQFLAQRIHIDLNTRLRLCRWPAAQALSAHAEFRRLAAFLSARYLTMQELAVRSQVAWPVCVEFLHAMHGLGLLERHVGHAAEHHSGIAVPPPSTTVRVRPEPAHAAQAHESASRVLGMLQRLRGRLGLAGAQAAHAG